MQIVFLIDGAQHLILTVVHWGDGQVIEGLFLWLAPQEVTTLLLQLPVTERTDHIVVFQSFRLMDREDPHAVGLLTLDRLATETLIPCCQEGVDIGGVLTHITC